MIDGYEFPIERGKVWEFARASGSQNPAYRGTAAVVPPTFLFTARMLWEPDWLHCLREIGFDLRRTFHGEEEYLVCGPPLRVGQTLRVSTTVRDQYERTGRLGNSLRFAVVVSEFRDSEGTLVAEQRSTILEAAPS